jgi:uncharacterized protein YndB with AHSA1/START domain
MKTLHFSIHIHAPIEKVWNAMLEDATYREWTAVFMPGSYFEGSWEEGAKIKFIAPDKNGALGGLTSVILTNKKYELVSIKHLGFIQNGIEITGGPEVHGWAGALETYTFKSENNGTTILIDLDTNDSEAQYFEETWPKALQKLKEIAEK